MPLSAIVGHGHLVALLRQAVAANRVPQSLLFGGPEGVGKRANAIALAQAVNCPQRREGDACGQCVTCQRIAREQHSDVVVVGLGEHASIRIDTLRERVLQVVGYRPFEAQRRVYIIDPADEMGEAGQAALLKTLEEPPPSAILILVSASPDALLPTVRSRCRRLRFSPLSESDVARVLVERCQVERAAAGRLAAVSSGSVSRALAMAEQDNDLAEDRAVAWDLIVAVARGQDVGGRLRAATALTQHAKSRRSREAVGSRLAVAASMVRDLCALSAGDRGGLANADLTQELGGLVKSFDTRRLSAGFAALARAQADLERMASPKVVADWVALSL